MINERSWTEYFRLLTPVLLFVLTIISSNASSKLNDLKSQIEQMDNKIFRHLTNEEMHSPRSQTVSRIEFDQYSKDKDRIIDRIYDELKTIRQEIQRRKE